MTEPDSIFRINGAALATQSPNHPFPYATARSFQAEYLDWLYDSGDSIAVLQAPTGGGKTAAFKELIKKQSRTLVIYPTNALMEQQQQILEDDADINVVVLNSEALTERGLNRREELLNFSRPPHTHDAIVTNPDILQAILQDQYIDPGSKLMRFFDGFDGIIYDEFHDYDAFAASGILLQLKIITERRPDAFITLASATPRHDYLSFLETKLDLQIAQITATYANPNDSDASQFRHGVELHRTEHSLWESRDQIAKLLRNQIETAPTVSGPRIALIFNSARDSNRFHRYLAITHPDIHQHAEKDNGYDTRSEIEVTTDAYILNTTSKGEIGLNYDIRSLYMDAPYTASSFIQRIGRAGRHTPATIYVYGLGHLPWPTTMDYQTFLDKIWETFNNPQENTTRLTGLVALRAARAITERETSDTLNPEVYADFTNVESFGRWKQFINQLQTTDVTHIGPFDPQPTTETTHLLTLLNRALPVLDTLRGRTLSHTISYQRGTNEVTTQYDLLSALRHNSVIRVENDVIHLTSDRIPDSIKIQYAGLPELFEYQTHQRGFIRQIQKALNSLIHTDNDNFHELTGIPQTQVLEYVNLLSPSRVITPEQITVDGLKLTINKTGDITTNPT